ncbi:hypothetical protein [Vibrio parahaemolyticus]|uniref:hypothetical protein n=1 Tax=Vibrio parahaemolyticus TaxID=670 RepID=UPI00111DE47E|nr:hypothetical protein [Vibrio parahaemolyticus]TOK06031.1 hypothetical protein CGI26_12175 [Vibrio parahaemolyticus]
MELNEIISAALALYGAGLSTYLAIKQYFRGRPTLKFSHDFTNLSSAPIMQISAFNPSSNPVHLLKVEYFLGSSSMPKEVLIDGNAVIEPYQFIKILVPVNLEDKYQLKVNRFQFSLANGQKFDHTLQQSLKHEVTKFRAQRLSQMAEFGLEASFDDAIVSAKENYQAMYEFKESEKEFKRLIQEVEELFDNKTKKSPKSDS